MGARLELPWGWFERRRGPMFLLAGVLLAIQVAYIGWVTPALFDRYGLVPTDYWAQLVGFWTWVWFFGAVGVVAGVGLLGLYPELASRSDRLARAGAGLAALAVLGGLVVVALPAVAVLGQAVGVFAEIGNNAALTVYNRAFGFYSWTLSLAMLAFAAGALRTDEPSRLVGGLLVLAAVYPRTPVGLNLKLVVPVPVVPVGPVAFIAVGVILWNHSGRRGPNGPGRARRES